MADRRSGDREKTIGGAAVPPGLRQGQLPQTGLSGVEYVFMSFGTTGLMMLQLDFM